MSNYPFETFPLTKRVGIVNPVANLDARYGPWSSLNDALTGFSSVLREVGLTVAVSSIEGINEYWYKDGIADENLILKVDTSHLTPLTLTNTLTSQLVLDTDFSDYQTSVGQATATLLPTTIYQNASGNWQGTFTNVQSNSANWNNNYIYTITNTNLSSNRKYAIDTLSTILTATLPQNPNYGDEIELFDVRGVWSTNSLVVVSNNYIEQRLEPLNCNVRFGLIKLIYTNDNIGWRIIPYPRHNVQPILAPNVSIQTNKLSGYTPLTVNLTGVNNLGEDIAPVSTWIWNLTGGNTPQFTTQNVTYTYQTSGTYVVNLTASNSVGTDTDSITISATTAAIPTSGLLVRYNADSGVAESGGAITSWTDQQNGVVATAFNGPALLTNEFDSRNAVSFDGTNDYFTFTLPSTLTSSQSRTIFVIGKYTNPTGRSQNGMLNSISPSPDLAYVFHNAFTSDAYFYTGSNQYGPAPFTPNAYMVQSIVQRTNGSGFIRVNGVPGANTSANTTENIDSFVIGGRSTSTERFLGTIVELLIYDRELTIQEIEQIETYANIP